MESHAADQYTRTKSIAQNTHRGDSTDAHVELCSVAVKRDILQVGLGIRSPRESGLLNDDRRRRTVLQFDTIGTLVQLCHFLTAAKQLVLTFVQEQKSLYPFERGPGCRKDGELLACRAALALA